MGADRRRSHRCAGNRLPGSRHGFSRRPTPDDRVDDSTSLKRVSLATDVLRPADHSLMTTNQQLFCAVLIAITACGGTAVTATTLEPAPTTTAALLTTTTTIPPTTTTTEATTTTVDEIAAAGAHYLEIVAPSNCLIEQVLAIEDSVRDEDGFISADRWNEMVDAGLLPLYAKHLRLRCNSWRHWRRTTGRRKSKRTSNH